MNTFQQFLEEKCDEQESDIINKDNYEAVADRWFENLDVQELIDYGEEYGKKCYEEGMEYSHKVEVGQKIIAGVDFTEPLDSLASITGSKLSDMLGKK